MSISFGDGANPVVEEERNARIDASCNDQLRHCEIGRDFGDLAGVDAVYLRDDPPLSLDRTLELQPEPLAIEVGELLDPRALGEDDRRRAALQDHRRCDHRQRARIGEHGLIGGGIAEIDVARADELDRYARSLAGENADVQVFVFEESLLLGDPDAGMLGAEYPIKPQAHLVLGFRRLCELCDPDGRSRCNGKKSCSLHLTPRLFMTVARMSAAICGSPIAPVPGYRFAHPGYTCWLWPAEATAAACGSSAGAGRCPRAARILARQCAPAVVGA